MFSKVEALFIEGDDLGEAPSGRSGLLSSLASH